MCTDSSELIISHQLIPNLPKISGSVPSRSTSHSINIFQAKPCEEAFESVKNFLVIGKIVNLLFKDSPNFESILKTSETWLAEISALVDKNLVASDDLKTIVSVDSAGKGLLIKLEISGVRDFEVIRGLKKRLRKALDKDGNGLRKKKIIEKVKEDDRNEAERLMALMCALTVTVYLRLGSQIDFGFGVEKPIDATSMKVILKNCVEREKIIKWADESNQPIATSCSFSSVTSAKSLNFYIFDGLKTQNIEKALSLLEIEGVKAPQELEDFFSSFKGDEVNCLIEFIAGAIAKISILSQNPGVCESMLRRVDKLADVAKWNAFEALAPCQCTGVELTSSGFSFTKSSVL